MRVRFFATCLGDRLFAAASADAVRLLRSLGVEVEIPRDATCCGQPAWNAGHAGRGRRHRPLGRRRPTTSWSSSAGW